MRLDFSQITLANRAFSDKPMTFCEFEPIRALSGIIELAAIETGNRKAREHWQSTQLRNLLRHAVARSAFWRQRIGRKIVSDVALSSLPVLTRSQVRDQVKSEGSLIVPGDPIKFHKHSTSGSTGVPVDFFVSSMNAQYNQVRSTAQFLLEGRELTLNRTQLHSEPMSNKNGFTVKKIDSWLGPLGSFIRSGINKHIDYFNPDMNLLRKELKRDSIGYLIADPRIVETMLQYIDPIVLKRAGMAMWNPIGQRAEPELRKIFTLLGIPVRASYSSEEVGIIGAECEKFPENYHIATSNVIVEISLDEHIQLGDEQVGRVLVTHLHSYATPFIRYDIGDLASLAEHCACGHDGPTLSAVFGRSKYLLKHRDGHVSIFYPRGYELSEIAKFDEYRIRQIDVETIIVEIGGRENLTPDEIAAFIKLIKMHAGDGFEVQVKPVPKIEWGHSVKRLGFHSEVL